MVVEVVMGAVVLMDGCVDWWMQWCWWMDALIVLWLQQWWWGVDCFMAAVCRKWCQRVKTLAIKFFDAITKNSKISIYLSPSLVKYLRVRKLAMTFFDAITKNSKFWIYLSPSLFKYLRVRKLSLVKYLRVHIWPQQIHSVLNRHLSFKLKHISPIKQIKHK
jgi:hypothetical protein